MGREKTYSYFILLLEAISLALQHLGPSGCAFYLLKHLFCYRGISQIFFWVSNFVDYLIICCVSSDVFRSLTFRQIMSECKTSVYSEDNLCLLSCDCLLLHIHKAMACHFTSVFSLAQHILSWYLNLESVTIHSSTCITDRLRWFCGDILSDMQSTAQDREFISVQNLTRWQLMENINGFFGWVSSLHLKYERKSFCNPNCCV